MPQTERPRRPSARPAPRAVVLGGTGFVGTHVCRALDAHGYDVLSVGRRPTGDEPPVPYAQADPLAGSGEEFTALLAARAPAVVVNAAGCVWRGDLRQMRRENVLLVRRLLAAVAGAARPPRLVHLGSAHEYGPDAPGPLVAETAPARPGSPYGRAKLDATAAVLHAAASGRADAVVLRLANIAGPGTSPHSLLGTVAAELVAARREKRGAVLRLAPLTAERDFVDVRDVAEAVVRAAGTSLGPHRVFNIGRGDAVPVRDLVDRLIAVSGVPAEIRLTGARSAVRAGAGDHQALDVSLAAARLGWLPAIPLHTSLADLWHAVVAAPGGPSGGSRRVLKSTPQQ